MSFLIKNEFPEKKISFLFEIDFFWKKKTFLGKHEFPEKKHILTWTPKKKYFSMNFKKKNHCLKCSRFYPIKRMNFVGLTIIKKSFHVKKCSRHTANDIFVG